MSPPADLRDQIRHVAYQPLESRTFDTAFGPGTVSVGPGFDQVVVTLTPAAADELARVIAASKRLDPGDDGTPPDADATTWFHVVVDLLTSSAKSNPRAYPAPRLVRLEGTAT